MIGVIFLYTPLIIVIMHSFDSIDTFKWYDALMHNTEIINSMFLSIKITLISTIITVISGVMIGLSLANCNKAWQYILYANYILPDIIAALSILGIIIVAGIPINIYILVSSYIIVNMSIISYRVIQSLKSDIDLARLEEAAQDLGASNINIIRYITLPRLLKSILSSGLFVACHILEDVILISFLANPGIPTLAIVILASIREGTNHQLNALSAIICLVFIIIGLIYTYIAQRHNEAQ